MRIFMAGLCLISPFLLSQIQTVWCTRSCFFSDLDKHYKLQRQRNIQQYSAALNGCCSRESTSPPYKRIPPGVSKGSLTAAPLQTASACPGCTAGRPGAFPGKRPVPCKAFRPRASALRPCHPATKPTTQLFRVLSFNSSIYFFFFHRKSQTTGNAKLRRGSSP